MYILLELSKEEIEYLVQKVKAGNYEAFEKLYDLLHTDLRKMSAQYFIAGGDENDVIQECRIGLWKAVLDYKDTAGMSFKNFAVNVCCKRHIITSVSHANRKKYIIHNSADSLDAPTNEDDDSHLSDFIDDGSLDLLSKIAASQIVDDSKMVLFDKLTKLETSIIELYLTGASYKEIAQYLKVKTKTVDNALMRIRKKAQELIDENEIELDGF